jgi:DNA (cytosine-5)-methyltransferase 1
VRYGSLCSGVGGLDLAVEVVFGAEVAWHAEVDREACRVLEKHWPGVPNYGDITAGNWEWAIPVNMVVAGPPCQPVSQAGQKKGPRDGRFLWDAVFEIVGVVRPGWVVFENPPGIRPWLPAIFYRLAQMGFVGCYGVVSAADVGACHRRERYFVLAAHPGRARYRDLIRELPPAQEPGRLPAQDSDLAAGFDWGPYLPAVARWGRALGRPAPSPWEPSGLRPRFLEWMMGLPEGWAEAATPVAQRRLLGNAVVPAQAACALRGLLARLGPLLGSSGY